MAAEREGIERAAHSTLESDAGSERVVPKTDQSGGERELDRVGGKPYPEPGPRFRY